ncbi:P2X purinoceptor [Archangium lipolyticum]|uniref:P2X purinoceptor n=1 Tax=Archangium lipolyticum TaxID=2970465 RepID=UPI00214A7615|nr:P2X purinoceptor [Archangium lipolyticum]
MRKGLLWAVMLGALGCHSGLGTACDAETTCPEGLVCSFPPPPKEGGEGLKGLCDYPPRGLDEPCSQAAECETALTCSNHFEPNTRYGRCVPRRASGEACFQDRDCATGRCEGASGSALDGTCAG